MSFVKAIARRDGEPGAEMLVPIHGNEVIFGKLSVRLRHLLDVMKHSRLHSLIAVDRLAPTDIIRGEREFAFHVCEACIEVSASGHLSLLLTGRDDTRLHWPQMTITDLEVMASGGSRTHCSWCGVDLVQAGSDAACPACRSEQRQEAFLGLRLWEMFQLPDGSTWQKITPNDAWCLRGGPKGRAGQSLPFAHHQEVGVV